VRSRDYRRLRQLELVRYAMQKFGRAHWKVRLAGVIGTHKNETGRWLMEDWSGNIQDRVEAWAEKDGFKSNYGEAMAPFSFHLLLLNKILEGAYARRAALPKHSSLTNAILPLNEDELDQAFAALGYDLISRD
jgi:hypothetical protein